MSTSRISTKIGSKTGSQPGLSPEIIVVEDDADEVSCDGGGGALGHPKVWYSFDGQDAVECGYCDRLFVKASATGNAKKQA